MRIIQASYIIPLNADPIENGYLFIEDDGTIIHLADIAPISGREARIADRIASEVSHQITVRYQLIFADPSAVARMRVLFKGRVFAIHGALNDDEANVAVILLASEGVRDG